FCGSASILRSKIYLAIAKYNSVNGQLQRLRSSTGSPQIWSQLMALDSKRAKIQVSINVDNPIQFERMVGFPNGDIGRVTLAYDGLHRFCFNCKHISHDENSCHLLSEQEREDRRQQRLEYNINNELDLPRGQLERDTKDINLKRPRSPPQERSPRPHHSPLAWRDERRVEKRQQNTQHGHKEFSKSYRSEPKHLVEDKYPQSLGRNPHKHNDVWNRIERPQKDRDSGNVPRQSSDLYRRNRDGRSSRNYGAKPKLSWRPRPNQATTYPREARSSAAKARIDSEFSNSLVDSQRTISENVMGLEPGEIQNAEAEIERIRLKGKGIASETPTSKEKDFHAMSALNRLAPLSIREPIEHPPSAATRYVAPGPLITPTRVVISNDTTEMDVDMIHGPNLDLMVLTETDLENIEKSVKEFENLEMDDEMIANDDLLGDAPGFDAVQIDALTQLSPVHTEIQDPLHDIPVSSTPERRSADYASLPQRTNIDTVMSHDGTASKLPVTQTRKPAGVLKRNVPKSPDEKAARASRKLNAA
ncbi:hypothetical protein HID58_080724, partial [Brassica napus]